jgi:hypothetical protein
MNSKIVKPAYITFTGVDRTELIPGMLTLSARYPIEWGVLIDPEQEEKQLFPTTSERKALLASALRFSAHVCGQPALDIAKGCEPGIDLGGVSRLQLNHSREGSSEEVIANAYAYSARQGLRLALQCQGEFPDDTRADWLYDVSFGTGIVVNEWPQVTHAHPFCGFSGGLSPQTVAESLTKFNAASDFWIDMESGVRSDGLFNLGKCEQVCELVYGKQ